jgi:signal transduction histidine kinase
MSDTSVVRASRSPTIGLLTGMAVILAAVAVYSAYTISQLRGLRRLQAQTIDYNRTDSLLLLRIQNDLNLIALSMRDMLDTTEPYPLSAWQGQFRRIRADLEDAMTREEARQDKSPPAFRSDDQRRYLSTSVAQFWDALDRIFEQARMGDDAEAKVQIRLSLQAREAALSTAVARLLVRNNESDQQAGVQTQEVYSRVERDVYWFLCAVLLLVLATSLYLVQYNRRMFQRVAALSQRRSELAQQLISIQENTFRYISRELHDEFGQILTAIGAMLQRVSRRSSSLDIPLRDDLHEVQEIVQSTLDKVRTLSQALHPVILEEAGLEAALKTHIPVFEKQTGIEIRYESLGACAELDQAIAIHLFRVLQEALNNVARHSKSTHAAVRLRYMADAVVLEVEDDGVGFGNLKASHGMGLVSMRERAGLVNGRLELLARDGGGALVRLTVPLSAEEARVGA